MSERQSGAPLVPVAAVAAGAACLWGSSRMTWVSVDSADGLAPPRTDHLLGSTWFGALTPLALALLAAVAAVLATKGGWRQGVGVVIAVIGGAAAVPALALISHSGVTAARAKSLADLPGRADVTAVHAAALPGVLALVGALSAFVAGVWLARRAARAGGLSGKYSAPAARKQAAARRAHDDGEVSERVLWDALDAGEDPTADKPADPG
ncbi:MAG: TIGR02234 family membrane protein [Mycobacteriaceae bacterium]|nr:TIGR02234 family membrane protein [Mycobacteriaceae bacterium]